MLPRVRPAPEPASPPPTWQPPGAQLLSPESVGSSGSPWVGVREVGSLENLRAKHGAFVLDEDPRTLRSRLALAKLP